MDDEPADGLLGLMRRISENSGVSVTTRQFIETVTFADPEEILAALRTIGADDPMAVPVWARNLAYRLAVLQRPDDAELLEEAGVDLYTYGPDWDGIAEELRQRAARMREANTAR
jgi:hypothetical protein